MDSKEHQALVDVIRGVHQKLRKAYLTYGDPNKVWAEHLEEHDVREKYSVAMFQLATEVWEGKEGKECRIEWAYNTCMEYFYKGGVERSLIRQMKLQTISMQQQAKCLNSGDECEDLDHQNNYTNLNRKLKLLDVGSCYNPFAKYEEFSCVAVDLTPVIKDVIAVDFLNIDVIPKTETGMHAESCKTIFYEESYDIVIMSLVLEYLPAPEQRAVFCLKSWQLLQENGLCIIITPDSNSVHHNAHMMKSWKLAMEKIGFIRVKYEKLTHLHCMAFRKIRKKSNESICWNFISELLFIPQDFNIYTEKKPSAERTEDENCDIYNNFLELPNEDLF